MKEISFYYLLVLMILNIIQCTSSKLNVALNMECQQSSTYAQNVLKYGPHLGVDGNTIMTTPSGGACAISELNQHPYWWTVNLGSTYTIDYITIYLRDECCWERLSYYYIYTYITSNATWNDYDAGPGELCYYHNEFSLLVLTIACNTNLQGQYVKILQTDPLPVSNTNPLILCEVEIYGSTEIQGKTRRDLYCKMSNKKSGHHLIVHHDSKSVRHCALLCQQTAACLGFDYTKDGVCSLAQTNMKVDSVDPQISYYMRC